MLPTDESAAVQLQTHLQRRLNLEARTTKPSPSHLFHIAPNKKWAVGGNGYRLL
jgi:hypothetical protein